MKRRTFLSATTTLSSLAISPTALTAVVPEKEESSSKKTLWLLLSDITHPDVHLVVPTLAWIAKEAGVEFECYLEAQRNGSLFARTGSTVVGGYQHQQFNYLNALFNVSYLLLGTTTLFNSSIGLFGQPILVQSDNPSDLYQIALKTARIKNVDELVFGPPGVRKQGKQSLEVGPYLYPDIYFRKALALRPTAIKQAVKLVNDFSIKRQTSFLLDADERKIIAGSFSGAQAVDVWSDQTTYQLVTTRIAERWKKLAKGLVFGDPAAILSQLPKLCREARIPLYAPKNPLPPAQVVVTAYTEEISAVADTVNQLAAEIGNPVIVGRQTGDGDLFHWSKAGVCIQIMDPNRPAFPIVETVPHKWTNTGQSFLGEEPDDATLERYADEGKMLATLMWHSGEMAHNEAMINLFEVVQFSGIKMGIGVHAARYETAPQMWELLNVPLQKGGVKGYVEPVLHSGGMGVLAECNCPPDKLQQHCHTSLARIKALAGEEAIPRGYYAFMDSDYKTLSTSNPAIYEAIRANGLEYAVSSVSPGRNQIVYKSGDFRVVNQSCRSVCSASPFVRITNVEDIRESSGGQPGWIIGTLDAPVISFNQYIWRHGPRFMEIVDHLTKSSSIVNVLPHTIARYARILEKKGLINA